MTCASGELSRGVPRPRAVTSIGGHEHLGGRKEAISALRWRHEKSQHLSLTRSGFFFFLGLGFVPGAHSRPWTSGHLRRTRQARQNALDVHRTLVGGWVDAWVGRWENWLKGRSRYIDGWDEKKSYIRKSGEFLCERIDGTIVKKCEGQQFFSCPVIVHFLVTCFYRGASSHC